MISFGIIALILFFTIAVLSKDRVVSGVAYLYSFAHLFNLFYYPSGWMDLCFEAGLCLGLGLAIVSQSVRTWAVSLAVILIMSITLIFVEFIDYFMFNSYFQSEYLQWIHITTVMEIIILALARNGFLHSYTNDYWNNLHHIIRDNFGKILIRQA